MQHRLCIRLAIERKREGQVHRARPVVGHRQRDARVHGADDDVDGDGEGNSADDDVDGDGKGNGTDDDCDGLTDAGAKTTSCLLFYSDGDGDGWGPGGG